MSKYFNEVEFELPENPGEPVKTPKVVFNPDKLKEAVNAIKTDIDNIKTGDSNLTTYAINPGSFGFPAANRLQIFVDKPTEENYKAFIEISKQDFGNRAATRFIEHLADVKEIINV